MKKVLYLIIILIFVACKKPVPTIPPKPVVTPQTTLMYMTGTDLGSFFKKNIAAAKTAVTAGALGYGRFLVFKHDDRTSGTLFELVLNNGVCEERVLQKYTDIASLTPECIERVVENVKQKAPAKKFNIIFSGHGAGWVLKDRLISTWRVGVARPNSIWEQDMSNPLLITRYMGSTNDGYLDISELRESLEATDTHFGYMLFDECFMSSVEVLYELRNLADYIVASPCEIMGNGFPYDIVLPELFENYGSDADLQGACQKFYEYYTKYSFPSGCIAMTVCDELESLAAITKEITSASNKEVDTESLQVYERLERHVFYDLEEYTLALCDDEKLRNDYIEQFDKTFPKDCRFHTERFFANIGPSESSADNYDAYYTTINYYSGVTTSAPSISMQSEWTETLWAKATKIIE